MFDRVFLCLKAEQDEGAGADPCRFGAPLWHVHGEALGRAVRREFAWKKYQGPGYAPGYPGPSEQIPVRKISIRISEDVPLSVAAPQQTTTALTEPIVYTWKKSYRDPG